MSKLLAVIGNLSAFFIFGAGLLSPLTPSAGMPTLGALVTFVGLPLVFLLHAWRVYVSRAAQYAAVFQRLCILGFIGWLLMLQSGVLANVS